MEYTVNVGDSYTTYEGTPEEIATLIHYEENGIDTETVNTSFTLLDKQEQIDELKMKLHYSEIEKAELFEKLKSHEELELIYDQQEAIEFIRDAIRADYAHLIEVPKTDYVKFILDYEEDYMRSKGII